MSNFNNSNNNNGYKNDMLELFDLEVPAEANLQLADPVLLNYYKDLDNRILWIQDITDNNLEDVKHIMRWNLEDEKKGLKPEDRKPIRMFIESFGGQVNVCFDLISMMKISTTPIYTYAMSATMSAGAVIFLNGHKRYITKLTSFLLHEGSTTGSAGTFSQVEANQSNYRKIQEMMRENILSNTNITKQQWGKKSKSEWFIYADVCIKLGIADKIIDNIHDIIG